MNHLVALAIFTFGVLSAMLTGCVAEKNFRGVPAPHWQELTGEQKQLIVDQAYEQEFNSTSSGAK